MKITKRAILHAAAHVAQVPLDTLVGTARQHHVVRVRQAAQYLCVRRLSHSLMRCGAAFQRDHTTVLHAVRETEARLRDEGPDGPTQQIIDAIWAEAKAIVKGRRRLPTDSNVRVPRTAPVPPPSLTSIQTMEHGSRGWFAACEQRWRWALHQLSQGQGVPQ